MHHVKTTKKEEHLSLNGEMRNTMRKRYDASLLSTAVVSQENYARCSVIMQINW